MEESIEIRGFIVEKLIEDRNLLISTLQETLADNYLNTSRDFAIINKLCSQIERDENKHFLSLSQDNYDKISYARNPVDIFNSNKRVKTTFEKYIRRQLKIDSANLSDSTLNYFGRQIRIKLTPLDVLDSKVEFLSGQEITRFYRNTDITSCMCHYNSYKTEMYSMNPDIVQLIIFDKESRALFWTTDCGKRIVDRIYPENCETSSMLRAWIERKGYVYRVCKGACDEDCINLSDGEIYEFKLKHNNVFPYLDTFCYGTIDKNKVILTNKNFTDCLEFRSTDGEYYGRMECYICEEHVDDHDQVPFGGETYCSECYRDRFSTCFLCDEVSNLDDMREGFNARMFCESCFELQFFYCNSCDDLFKRNEEMNVNHKSFCKNCFNEEYSLCDKCEKIIEKSELVEYNDLIYCQECFEKSKI